MEFEDILWFVNLVGSGVAAGVLVTVAIAFIPLMREFGGASALRIRRTVDPLIDRVNPPAVVLSAIAGVLVIVVAQDLPQTTVVFTILGLVGSVGVAATSVAVNMRINRLMRGWSTEVPPPEYPELQRRWNRFHAVRTASGLLAFGCYVVAILGTVRT